MSPIEWETIWQKLEDAFEAYGRKIKGRQTWADVIFGFDYEYVDEAIKTWVRYNENPPRPSQLLHEVKKLLQSSEKSTTVESMDEEMPEAPEIVKRAYLTWMKHSLGMELPIHGAMMVEPLPLEEAIRVMKQNAESCGLFHLLPPEVQKAEV